MGSGKGRNKRVNTVAITRKQKDNHLVEKNIIIILNKFKNSSPESSLRKVTIDTLLNKIININDENKKDNLINELKENYSYEKLYNEFFNDEEDIDNMLSIITTNPLKRKIEQGPNYYKKINKLIRNNSLLVDSNGLNDADKAKVIVDITIGFWKLNHMDTLKGLGKANTLLLEAVIKNGKLKRAFDRAQNNHQNKK